MKEVGGPGCSPPLGQPPLSNLAPPSHRPHGKCEKGGLNPKRLVMGRMGERWPLLHLVCGDRRQPYFSAGQMV